jgi:atypical dual specificity phosphatase
MGNSPGKKWYSICKFNEHVQDTSIIPIKCPMDYKSIPEKDKFYWQEIISHLKTNEKPVTGIVDLTGGWYYKKEDFEKVDSNIKYLSVKIKGKTVPNKKILTQILDFIKDHDLKGQSVVIHCKHGLNRTGFIICAYLVLVKHIRPDDAINFFETARGENIVHKQVYYNAIRELIK